MPAASILLLLLIAFVASRLFRSTKMWWTFMSTIMAGLLVGMLSREVIGHENDNKTSRTQLVETTETVDLECMQSLATCVGIIMLPLCLTGVAGNITKSTKKLSDIVSTNNTEANGRDSSKFKKQKIILPEIIDDS